MSLRDMLRTKTFWSGLSLVLYGGYQILEGDTSQGIQNVLTGLSIIFLRQAVGSK